MTRLTTRRLGQPPRDAFLGGQARSGHRPHRYIADYEEFGMMTLPTTAKGTARVVPGRGVKINYIFYWCEGFREAVIEGTEVAVRYDPFDISHAYAFVRNQWRQCVSEHYLTFSDRSECELMMASAELRQRNRQHGRRFTLTARRLADFLNSVGTEESTLIRKQRQRNMETRQIRQRIERGAPPSVKHPELTTDDNTQDHAAAVSPEQEQPIVYRLITDEAVPDLSKLEV